MHSNAIIPFLPVAVLLLAKSEGVPGQRVEVRTSNTYVEVVGFDGDHVVVGDSSRATVKDSGGRTVVMEAAEQERSPLTLQVPRQAALDVVTSNGAIRISGVAGPLRLTTSNGSITVQNAGSWEIHAYTSNGRIEVQVPAGLNANVSASTSNGNIHSDIGIVTNLSGGSQLNGRIGKGGPEIDLQTSNSSIYLKSAGNPESVSSTFKPGEVK